MDILISIDDAYADSLQRMADARGFADIPALCFAPVVELAKAALADAEAEDDAALLGAVKNDPALLASARAAVAVIKPNPPIRGT